MCTVCPDLETLCEELRRGAGTALITEEALAADSNRSLSSVLDCQPAWSDFPLVVLAREGTGERRQEIRDPLNVTLIERPLKVRSLLTVIRAALRARRHQYAVRDYLAEREQGYEARARLAAIVESSADAIVSKSLDGTILSWNAGAESLFGYTADEAVGRFIGLIIPEDRLPEETEILAKIGAGERVEHFETQRLTKDGRLIDLSLTISPIRGRDGRVVGASKVARDITERKRAEAELLAADRKKDDFIALLAHELRNPLAPIRNGLSVMRLGTDPVAIAKAREMMDRQLVHMVRLIDDLLDISRINRNKMTLRLTRMTLADVVNAAVETARPTLDAAHHVLTIELPKEPIQLDADLTRLGQVFGNLLTNSAKYTPPGGRIVLAAHRDGNEVTVTIRDDGIGIPADSLPHIFDMFSQVDRSVERSAGGLGIGLALVKGLVEMHRGRVKAESAGEGCGSVFTVTLPTAAKFFAARDESAPANGKQVSARRILVVDDNRDSAESMAQMLRLLGNEVTVAYDGYQAVKAAERVRPHAILMDVGMPGLNGLDATRAIRAAEWGQEVTILALTGWGQDSDRENSRDAGCNGHLVKPVELEELERFLAESPVRA